jgi:hypothetical protein
MDRNAGAETNAGNYELPPFRDRLPTIPHDLSDYARAATGPSSWSAEDDTPPPPWMSNFEPFEEEIEEDIEPEITAGELFEVRPSDIPCPALTATELAEHVVDSRERVVLSILDGQSTLSSYLTSADLPDAELLAIVCDLVARGLISLQRKS